MRREYIACVLTHNRKNQLIKCIDSLLAQTNRGFDIYVLDNDSNDGTQEILSDYIKNGLIKYEKTRKNLGCSGGMNYAIRRVVNHYKYIWVMDDDTYPTETAFDELKKCADALNGEFGFISSLALWKDGSLCEMNIQSVSENVIRDVKYTDSGMLRVESGSFVSLLFPAEAARKHGLPIKEFFIWSDDVEFTYRLKQDKGFLAFHSVVIHDTDSNINAGVLKQTTPERIDRCFYEFRNSAFIARRKGVKVGVKYYLKSCYAVIKVIVSPVDYKGRRILAILKGLCAGLFFNPKIEYPSKKL